MPNCFTVAKRRWEAQNLDGAVRLLNECLEQELAGPAFAPTPELLSFEHFTRFETVVATMLADEHIRRTSFGDLFAVIWRWHPDDIWVGVLLDFNFFSHFNHFGFEEALVEPLRQLGGFDRIVDVLGESAEKGLLAPEFEGPNSGRPTLRIADIQNVKEECWGPLKPNLLARLTGAYQRCPKDFWARLAASEPADVLMRFLHDLFGNYSHPVDVAELRWKAITRDHIAYATAVLTSLEYVLNSYDSPFLTEIVRLDAGFWKVMNGRDWLAKLLVALRTSDFIDLEPSRD